MAMQSQYNNEQNRSHLPGGHPGLIIDISPELRHRIELAAVKRGTSVREYVAQILEEAVPSETDSVQERKQGHLNAAAIEDLLRTREEFIHAHPGLVFEDSSEVLHQLREERLRELEQQNPMTREAFEGLLQLRERIKQNHPGQIFEDSNEIIWQMREERLRELEER